MSVKGIKIAIFISIIFLIGQDGNAQNIVGGYLQIAPINNLINRYKISLRLHIDETTQIDGTAGSYSESVVNVKMIRKKDGSEIESFKLVKHLSEKVNYDLDLCFGVVEFKSVYVNYEADISVYPPSYADSEGYYLEWTDCCRRVNITNIKNSESHTLRLRTLFPAIIYQNVPFFNSTPAIGDLPELLICNSAPFEHKMTASDPDGDDLKFSLVNPGGNHSSSNSPLEWRPGRSATNAIPGNPTLTINSTTGLLTVKPEMHGQYVFAICVEEYRDGRRIGAVVREYMLYVLDCLEAVNTDRNVYLNNVPVSTATICTGNRVTLTVKTTPNSRYQWMRNGKDIPGATSSILEINQEGDYSITIFRSGNCSNVVESKKVHVTSANRSLKLEKHAGSAACDMHSETVIVGPKDLHYTYNWYKNNTLLTNKSNSLTVLESGNYWAIVESSSCRLFSDTVTVEQLSNPNVKVEMEYILPTCGSEDTPIRLIGSPTGGIFQGAGVVDGIFYPKQAGIGVHELTYTLSTTPPCPNAIAKQTVEVQDGPKFDLVKEICVTSGIGSKIGIKESSGYHYEWSPQEGLDMPSVSMPVVTTDVDRSYTLTVTNANGCKTVKNIQVKICSKFFIPDAFTPNGDGINDTWELAGINKYPNAEVTIFNRWGIVIFYSKGYTTPFDGASNQAGVYHYKIKLNEVLPPQSGPLVLIR